MTTLYTWNTPNGQKPAILLEELGIDYAIERYLAETIRRP